MSGSARQSNAQVQPTEPPLSKVFHALGGRRFSWSICQFWLCAKRKLANLKPASPRARFGKRATTVPTLREGAGTAATPVFFFTTRVVNFTNWIWEFCRNSTLFLIFFENFSKNVKKMTQSKTEIGQKLQKRNSILGFSVVVFGARRALEKLTNWKNE